MFTTYDCDKKEWSGAAEEPIYNHKNSLGQILFHQLSNFANKVIQIDDTAKISVTGQQALTWGIRIAQHLKQKMHLNHTDIIGISSANTNYVLPVALGSFFSCVPFHGVNPTLDEGTIAHCYGLTKPKVIFCSGSAYEKIRKATESFRPLIYTTVEHIAHVPCILDLLGETESEKTYRPESLTLEDTKQTVAILCSSGTTGKPKAVCLSTPLLLGSDNYHVNGSVFYISSTIDWGTGLFFLISSCLKGFTRVIHTGPFEVVYLLNLLKKYNINSAFLSSNGMAALVQHPGITSETLSCLRTITYSGSRVTEAVSKRLTELCGDAVKAYFIYGSTEMFYISENGNMTKPKSVGKLSNRFKMIIVDDNGQRLGHNETGEIVLKNPVSWIGYYANRSESEKAVDGEGWFHTGDVGYVDEDNDLFIVDRKKEILKYQGFHYWPREIEQVIADMPGVHDVCVVSVFDAINGDLAGALVVKRKGSAVTEQHIIDHVKQCFSSPHKQIHAGVYFVEQLPHNHNGKVIRKLAKELLQRFVDRKQ